MDKISLILKKSSLLTKNVGHCVCYYSVFLSKLTTFCINSVSFLFLLLIDVHVLHLNYIIISLDDNFAKKIVKCVLFLGTGKLRNETKRNETKTKSNEICKVRKRNPTKWNEICKVRKRNQTKSNEICKVRKRNPTKWNEICKVRKRIPTERNDEICKVRKQNITKRNEIQRKDWNELTFKS